MAKEKFYRTKPHVNGGALAQIGFSALGILQITSGQMVTNPQDRDLAAEVLTTSSNQASGQATGKRQHMPIRFRAYVDSNVFLKLGFSAAGAHQIAMGAVVTDPQDRGLVAEILTGANMPWFSNHKCQNP